MMVIVAHSWALVGNNLKGWINAVMLKLIDVGVISLRSFIVQVRCVGAEPEVGEGWTLAVPWVNPARS
jgi:hypothetical protein